MSLKTFTDAYIAAMLFSETDDDGDPLDDEFGPQDLAPEARSKVASECEEFYNDYHELWPNDAKAGHNFALSRNGHSTGFFDDDSLSPSDRKTLQRAAGNVWGEQHWYVGAGFRIYVS